MKNSFKLNLVAAAVLMASSVAYAGTANLPGDGSAGNAYQMGLINPTPTVLGVLLTGGSPLSVFDEYADFTIGAWNDASGVGNSLLLTFYGINVSEILDLTIEVWSGLHTTNEANMIASFSGDNITNAIGILPAGQYHLDISGQLGPSTTTASYAVALSAVPEPETYAMLLAGLGLVGFSARRRKVA